MNIIERDYNDAKSGLLEYLLRGFHQKIYVEAWKGVGATALLREVAEEGDAEAVAEQLNHLLLPSPPSVTAAAFDAADEDDDFSGVEFSSRDSLSEVVEQINRALRDRTRVLLVLCNNIAGGKLIEPYTLPFSIIGWPRGNAVLWTSGMNISMEAASASAERIVRIQPSYGTTALDLVYKEAVEIARYIDESSGGSLRTTGQVVLRCFWYCLLLLRRAAFNRSALLPDGGRPWKMLSRKGKEFLPPKTLLIDSTTRGDWVKFSLPSSEEEEASYRWISVRSPQTNIPEPWDFFFKVCRNPVTSGVSSFFGHFEETHQALPDGFFDHFSNVRVLDLLGCVVSPIIGFSSFLRLRNLRMLRLERCKVITEQCSADPSSLSLAQEEQREPILFDNLWVLNLYNSDADTFLLAGKAFELMPNLLELDLKEETSLLHLIAQSELREHMHKLAVLELSENINTNFLQKSLSMTISLKVLILTNCMGLVFLNFNLPPTIETISLQGCASLKKVQLVDPAAAPLPNLKTFLLSSSKLIAKLSLQGCRKLENVDLQELTVSSACDVDRCLDFFRNQTQSELTKETNDANQRLFHAHVVVKDVRLFRSLQHAFPDLSKAKSCFHIHVKGSSTAKRGTNIGTTTRSALCYADVLKSMTDRHRRHHPSPHTMPLNNHIEADGGHDSRIVEDSGFRDIMEFANSLFIHDNTFNFTMGIEFKYLKCFRIERCPNLEFIFSWIYAARSLESIWLSQLPRLKALHKYGRIRGGQLKHIYLEFCARLEYVLPSLSELHDLETINIRYCGDLTVIFKSDDDNNEDEKGAAPKLLPKLRSIHLQELPKLRHIYKQNIRAPLLEEIKIMGCFNLKKLSFFGRSDVRSMRAVKISCEKDWWISYNGMG
uniref:Disease resistance protein At4g27190-like leucine-rich repeats domain-containing protein n=1 Tax=Ananas comosus var. bracteatus TaxID=296719 RepID=A0A6V7PPT9_ANACO|nr:unnamed protein product [Ananas comosus var. bracteatus]